MSGAALGMQSRQVEGSTVSRLPADSVWNVPKAHGTCGRRHRVWLGSACCVSFSQFDEELRSFRLEVRRRGCQSSLDTSMRGVACLGSVRYQPSCIAYVFCAWHGMCPRLPVTSVDLFGLST
eukprot:1728074-Amphidinium_carterae.1